MKNATLRQLTIFATVAKHLHFTRAAEELGTTQPSVSIQIKQLEENVGISLFEQLGKKVFLTEAGQELYRYCQTINQHLAEAEIVLSRLRGVTGGRLNLCIGRTAKYFVPQLLAAFCRQHGNIFVNMEIIGRQQILQQLADNTCDMAIMGLPPEDLDFVAKPFLDDPLVVIAHPDHPLVQEREIPLLRLAQESFLMRESDSAIRKSAETLFANAGVEILPSMVINSNEAVKQSVRVGLGLAVVPLHSVTLEIEKKCLAILDVVMMPLHRSWYLVHRQGKRFSSVADSFKDFVIEEAQHTIESNITANGSSSAGVQNTAPCVDSERVSRRRR